MISCIVDSNIIIYASDPLYSYLLDYLSSFKLQTSVISEIEVFGFQKITKEKINELEIFFKNVNVINLETAVIKKSIELKQSKKMSLGDSIIAATALVHQLPLITRNSEDFKHIPDLQLLNPFEQVKA